MRDKDEFLTPEEASKYLKVNIRTIYRWAHAREIPAMRAGRQWRFRMSELDKWLKKQARLTDRFRHKRAYKPTYAGEK